MKPHAILVIDNRDSFVFNLVRYLQELEVPVLVREADSLTISEILQMEPAGILLSPGPKRPSDAVLCLDVVRRLGGRYPILGVCLGHQVIAEAFGARVVEGETPVHGKNALIHHDGEGVFSGLPNPFSATRYHSLVVQENLHSTSDSVFPDCLSVTARTTAGVVMGIRHRTLPIEGVQFHPEAELTECGHALLANFARQCGLAVNPQGWSKASGEPAVQRLPLRRVAHGDVAARVFRLLGDITGTVFLDSAKRVSDMGTTSLVAWSPWLAIHATSGQTLRVRYDSAGTILSETACDMDVLTAVEQELQRLGGAQRGISCGFSGGAIGFLGYESWNPENGLPTGTPCATDQSPFMALETGSSSSGTNPCAPSLGNCAGNSAERAEAIPDAWFWFHRAIMVFHHDTGDVELLVVPLSESRNISLETQGCCSADEPSVDKILSEARALLDYAESEVSLGKPMDAAPVSFPHGWQQRFHSNFSKPDYLAAVEAMRQYIRKGDIYIANMTQQFTTHTDRTGREIHDRLRTRNPSAFSAYFPFGTGELISASPERLLQIRAGWVETRPIKGTRPRGKTPEEDVAHRRELEQSEKDKAELLMITDLERNDLSRVCDPGTVAVSNLFEMETLPTVHHLVATVRGRLRNQVSVTECLRACFPGGSITGAPKIRAMEVIRELERCRRGPYTGALGWMDVNGNADFSILIRSLIKQGNNISFGVGGGITWESNPEEEYAETLDKAKALMDAVSGAASHHPHRGV